MRSTRTADISRATEILEWLKNERADNWEPTRHSIYFIQSGNGPIKIGYTTVSQLRFSMLQVGNPEPLKIIKILRGGREEETAIHKKFKRDRLRGEWYIPSPELLKFINDVDDNNLKGKIDRYKIKANRIFTKGRVHLGTPEYEAAL